MGNHRLLASSLAALVLAAAGCSNGGDPTAPPPSPPAASYLVIEENSDLRIRDLSQSSFVSLTSDSTQVEDFNANFTADAERIVWLRSQTGQPLEIWTMTRGGADRRKLADGYIAPVGACAPNGHVVSWVIGSQGEGTIQVVDLAGAPIATLANDGLDKYTPQWSPSGDRIAYIAGPRIYGHPPEAGDSCDVYVMNADGSNAHQLTSTAGQEMVFAWSPAGDKLAVVRLEGAVEKLYAVDASSGAETYLADVTWPDGRHYPVYATWSVDGMRVFFRAAMDGRIRSIAATGGVSVDVSGEAASQPFRSGSGRIAFGTASKTIIVTNPDGSRPGVAHVGQHETEVEAFR